MKLTVVGCSGSFPSAESACSSYLVEADGFRLLLDMGNGALGELQRHCGLYDLDAIFLSHLHADHCIDMCGYFVARYYRHDGGRCEPHPGLRPRGHRAAADHRLRRHPLRLLHERGLRLPHGQAAAPSSIGPFTVHTERVRHPVEAYGIRIEHGGQTLDVLRRHRRQRRAGRPRPRTPTCSCARPPSRTARRTSPTCTSTAARRARRRPRGRPPAGPHPHPAVDRPAGQPRATPARSTTARWRLAAPGAVVRDLRRRVRARKAPGTVRGSGAFGVVPCGDGSRLREVLDLLLGLAARGGEVELDDREAEDHVVDRREAPGRSG